jgi:hypothetical protein
MSDVCFGIYSRVLKDVSSLGRLIKKSTLGKGFRDSRTTQRRKGKQKSRFKYLPKNPASTLNKTQIDRDKFFDFMDVN